MRRMIVGVVILLAIFTGWLWEKSAVTDVCSEMSKKLDIIGKKVQEGNTADVMNLTKDFKTKWHKKEKLLDMLTPHDDTDEINLNLVRMENYVRDNNFMAVKVVVKEMKEHFREIEEKLQVNYTNIF